MSKRRKLSTFERLNSGKMNRAQRKELARRVCADDPGLEVVHRNVAGIDVGNESHYVAVAPGCDRQPVREFGCRTADLKRMAEWLKCGCRQDCLPHPTSGIQPQTTGEMAKTVNFSPR